MASFKSGVTYTVQDLMVQFDKTTPLVIVHDLRNIFVRFVEVKDLEKEFGDSEIISSGDTYIVRSKRFMNGIPVRIIKNEKSSFFERRNH